MQIAGFAETWDQFRVGAFKRRDELAWPAKLGLALLMAALTGLAAQVRFHLPHTPVPVTGQTFAVLLSGILLGARWGGLSQALYVGLGAAGLPWFSGWSGGFTLGPTAGYLLGFIVAAVLVGWVTEHFVAMCRFAPLLGLMLAAILVIYAFGAAGYWFFLRTDLWPTLQGAVLPFIVGDVIKIIAAASAANLFLPKRNAAETRDPVS